MRAFVTGGTGFVGAHLVAALVERGDAVTCLVRSPTKARALGWSDAVRVVAGDLDDAEALRRGCAVADVVYHLAGRVSAEDQAAFFRANRDGTARVLEAAAAAGVGRFLLVSSLAVAGPSPPDQPHATGEETGPVTDYGASKLAAEELVQGSSLAWTVVRPPAVYGEWDVEFLRLFKTARFGVAPVFGDGSQRLSLVYAGDLAAALVAAATAPATVGRTYYPAHPEVVTARAVSLAAGRAMGAEPRVVPLPAPLARGLLWTIGAVAKLAGRATVLSADKAAEFLAPAWTCSPEALTRDTGWTATTDLATGFARAVAWYRARGWL
jgi:nucleoside-diphosphate-sugar epimerase